MSKTNLFGTDGIRGIVCEYLTPSLAYKVGKVLAIMTKEQNGTQILIGGDTRKSTDMLKYSLVSGILSHGIDVVDAGIVPTPAVSYLSTNVFTYGVMITASHNPPEYNGIKIFDNSGNKLCDKDIKKLQYIFDNINDYGLQTYDKVGCYHKEDIIDKYINHIVSNIDILLSGNNVAIDCSYGACSSCVESVYKRLQANATIFNDKYNGLNINENCGALHPEFLQKTMLLNDYDIGFAFDGDGDRVVCVLKDGRILDGDSILYVLAKYLKKLNMLYGDTIVATILSNCGFEHSLLKHNIKLLRTAVGDKNVSARMQKERLILGGEKGGHIIFNDFSKTGDGIFISTLLLKLQKLTGIKIESMLEDLVIYPYIERNIEVPNNKKDDIIHSKSINEAVEECQHTLLDKGRIVLRPSGTESKIRILVEGNDDKLNERIVNYLENKIKLAIECL